MVKQKGIMSNGFFETPLYSSTNMHRKGLWSILVHFFNIIQKF